MTKDQQMLSLDNTKKNSEYTIISMNNIDRLLPVYDKEKN